MSWGARTVFVLTVTVVLAAQAAFVFSVRALDAGHDVSALYWLAIGALLLKGSLDGLRPGELR